MAEQRPSSSGPKPSSTSTTRPSFDGFLMSEVRERRTGGVPPGSLDAPAAGGITVGQDFNCLRVDVAERRARWRRVRVAGVALGVAGVAAMVTGWLAAGGALVLIVPGVILLVAAAGLQIADRRLAPRSALSGRLRR